MDERILYVDEHIAVVVKKAGEICEHNSEAGLPEVFSASIESRLGFKPECIECVHRLDRPVSGVAVLALDKISAKAMSAQFATHEKVRKIYWAVSEGVFEKDNESRLLSCFMIFNPAKQKAYIVDENHRKAKKAELKMKCFGHGDRYSFIEIELLTGRTHQIRLQLAKAGMCVKGDVKYGARRADTIPGIRLLSHRIDFVHPVTKEKLSFVTSVPEKDPLWLACESAINQK